MTHDWANWQAYRAGYLRAMKDMGQVPRVDGDAEEHMWEMYSRYLFDELERLWAAKRREDQ